MALKVDADTVLTHFRYPDATESEALQLLTRLHDPATVRDKEPFAGCTLLHHACSNGWYEVVRVLREERGCSVNCKNYDGASPLHRACANGQVNIARFLTDHHADTSCRDKYGDTPLHHACYRGELEIVKLLIELKCNPKCVNKKFQTPLHVAYAKRHLTIAGFLVDHHVDPSRRDKYGDTPLHYACYKGDLEIVKLLIELKCDPMCVNNVFQTPLHVACAERHFNIARFLIDHHANPSRRDKYGDTPLHDACYKGDLEIVKLLIERKCDPMRVNNVFQTPLHVACAKQHFNIARFLVDHHVDPSRRDKYGDTPLHDACYKGDLEIVKLLIERKCDPMRVNNKSQTPLHVACAKRHFNIAKFLIDHHADPARQDRYGNTPLHYACCEDDLEIVKLLIERKCDPMCVNNKSQTPLHMALKQCNVEVAEYLVKTYKTIGKMEDLVKFALGEDIRHGNILHYACEKGSMGIVKFLIERKCDPMCVNKESQTPLHVACASGHLNIARFLINHHADPSRQDKYCDTPLHHACYKGDLEIVKFLIEQKCDPMCVNKESQTPLHVACASGHLNIARFLINHHADPSRQDKYYDTPLHHACYKGDLEIVKFLIEQKCDPMCVNKESQTPLHVACASGHLNIARFLINHHADPSRQDKYYDTPLHHACYKGDLEIVKFLIEQKCDPMCVNNELKTPLHVACERRHLNIARFLMGHHADPSHQDISGDTPLHVACSFGCLEIVKVLVKEHNCDLLQQNVNGFTPFSMAYKHGHADIIAFSLSIGIVYCTHPFHPAFKVFVMGNSSAGKSTLVKAIQNKLTDTAPSFFGRFSRQFRRVTGVEPHTAGIIPVHIESQELGHIIMYDFAGQHQYYSNHAALLESLASSQGALMMVVIDLSKSKDENIRTLHYWNSIIQNHCIKLGKNPPILVIASHADVVIAQKEDPSKKISDILESLATSPGALHCIIGHLALNCTRLESNGLRNTCGIIVEHCTRFQENFDVDVRTHFLYNFICENFRSRTACRVSEIVSSIRQDKERHRKTTHKEKICEKIWDRLIQEYVYEPGGTAYSKRTHIPGHYEVFITTLHLAILSDNGHFLYLRNDLKFENGWVILDKQILLSEVSGTLFAPENFKEHRDISSSTGVAPLSKIKEAFPNHDPEMIIGFLTHFEFCQRIAESESALISVSQTISCQQQSETFYFFPALVSEDRPTESCRSIEQTHYKCGWSLQSTRPDQFLSPRFLHVLLLRLAFSFALAPEEANEDKACPVLKRRCNVWKEGIHWQNRDGIEAIVEVVEQNTAVTVMIGCLEGCELECVKLRSELLRTILETKGRFSGAVEMRESLLHPAELASYPLSTPKLLTTFTITELATALGDGKPVITRKERQKQEMLTIDCLLHFEAYTCFSRELLAKLMDENNAESEISDDFLSDVAKVACSKIETLKQVLNYNKSELRVAIGNCRRSPEYDTPEHHCYLLFRTWKECTAMSTYQAFRSALDKYSVFCGRNPLALQQQMTSVSAASSSE